MMMLHLHPDGGQLTIQVEIVARIAACTRWHQDNYTGRAIITYVGPGTWCADDKDVCYDQFAATLGEPMAVSDPRIVPDFSSVHQPRPNAVVLIKGDKWPGICGVGLTHKAPNIYDSADGKPLLKRLILKVDIK